MNKKVLSCVIGLIAFIIMVVFDQFTKKLVVLHLKDHPPIDIVKNVFQLRYLENRGAAFGILQGQRSFFLVITIIILALIVYCYIKIPSVKKYRILHIIMVMIAAGAVGNLIDRSTTVYVVDFLYFILINFPIFNVADCYVSISVVLLVLIILFKYKDAEMAELKNCLLNIKKKEDTK